jgi:hypothetical protein
MCVIWSAYLYRLLYRQCIRWPWEDDNTQAGEGGQGMSVWVQGTWSLIGRVFWTLWKATGNHLPSTHTNEVNKFWCELFCARRGEVESTPSLWGLPLRACTACKLPVCDLFSRSLQIQPFPATDCSWMTDEDGKLAVNWMQGSPALDAAIQEVCVNSFNAFASAMGHIQVTGMIEQG